MTTGWCVRGDGSRSRDAADLLAVFDRNSRGGEASGGRALTSGCTSRLGMTVPAREAENRWPRPTFGVAHRSVYRAVSCRAYRQFTKRRLAAE